MMDPKVPGQGGEVHAADQLLRELLVRYFRPGMVDSLIRTWVPIALGYGLSWLATNYSWLGLPERPSATMALTVGALVSAGYYWAARTVERRWPAVGRWLVSLGLTSARPTYAAPSAASTVERAAARPAPAVGRHWQQTEDPFG